MKYRILKYILLAVITVTTLAVVSLGYRWDKHVDEEARLFYQRVANTKEEKIKFDSSQTPFRCGALMASYFAAAYTHPNGKSQPERFFRKRTDGFWGDLIDFIKNWRPSLSKEFRQTAVTELRKLAPICIEMASANNTITDGLNRADAISFVASSYVLEGDSKTGREWFEKLVTAHPNRAYDIAAMETLGLDGYAHEFIAKRDKKAQTNNAQKESLKKPLGALLPLGVQKC
jgi:hypothetical protein